MTPEQDSITEDALFDTAVDPPSDPTPDPAPAPAPAEKPQAEQVERAAPPPKPEQDAAPPPAGDKPKVDDDAPMVPSWRLKEIREERSQAQAERDALKRERDQLAYEQQEFRRRLAQLEKPAEQPQEPDPLLDPRGYREFMEKRFEERLTNERREMSLQSARRVYRDEFDQAYEAARQLVDPALRARMQHSADPGETLIGWFRELKMRAEIGNDVGAYRKKVSDEMLKDPEFRKRAMEAWRTEAQTAPTNGRPLLAPSLNGVSRSSAALRASQQELSDDALWDTTLT